MRSRWAFPLLVTVVATGLCVFCPRAGAQDGAAPLTFALQPFPDGMVGSDYSFRIQMKGGQSPLTWVVTAGKLPPGLTLNPSTGAISGTARGAGEFRFTVRVSDYSVPVQQVRQDCTIVIRAALTITWKKAPKVKDDRIDGSVVVSNYSNDDFDLTVIIVAVNEYGKAFALGYQKFTLAQKVIEQPIPFGLSLPRGQYTVHADAIAEVAEQNTIFRARVQTPISLPVTYP
ncbi:MAG TPA: Ig domain-containing protein [Terriglobales bacterium]|nr:Ig domain-containing protein [Terriglobales bacterium]